ncbi:PDR/VanB family oxidoreductase [Rhizobium sp. ICMP 5592]|uniref:PDR/VanB family oxidoreductase n=1 Tax=Rhizobium sp. ICMP 5592 TaxID=2292445 RepID=UPI0012969CEA|nr:PDR/VanB family oxidoreductase [Rhizobium sp. ICMP 5592]MQB40977.1 oxidoreductase [Rhizobium sp. ICMP 5592]
MRSRLEWRKARVIEARTIAEDVRAVTFAIEGLPAGFDPGSHTNIRVRINGELAIRTYTVLPGPHGTLSIAVKRHPNSRGGSVFIWQLQPGDETELTEPENRFELSWRASRYLLIAGGIGITPIYGMARTLASRGQMLRLAYAAKSHQQMAFLDELGALLGDRLQVFAQDDGEALDLDTEFAALPPDGEAYICGPLGLLEAARQAWQKSRRSMSRLRYEVFGDNGLFAEQAFDVEVAELGARVRVRADQSMLDVLVEAGVDMVFDCRRGECGLCAVNILETDGAIDHRDVFFSEAERRENSRMCACVSRACGGRIVIDTGYRPDIAAAE